MTGPGSLPVSRDLACGTASADFYDAEGDLVTPLEEMPPPQRVSEIRRFHAIAAAARLIAGQSVLDIGCGSGDLLAVLTRPGVALHGVDVADSRLAKARDRLRSRGVEAELSRGVAEALPYPDASFDAVVCSEVLEHLPDPSAAIAEMVRVLKPDGRIVVTVPNEERIRLMRCVHCGCLSPRNGHLHSFDSGSLALLLEGAGLSVAECRPTVHMLNRYYETRWLLFWIPARPWAPLDAAVCRATDGGQWLIAVGTVAG